MPLLKRLYLQYIFVCPELVKFLIGHASTFESVSLSDCYSSTGYRGLAENGIPWDALFTAFANVEPRKLRQFNILPLDVHYQYEPNEGDGKQDYSEQEYSEQDHSEQDDAEQQDIEENKNNEDAEQEDVSQDDHTQENFDHDNTSPNPPSHSNPSQASTPNSDPSQTNTADHIHNLRSANPNLRVFAYALLDDKYSMLRRRRKPSKVYDRR